MLVSIRNADFWLWEPKMPTMRRWADNVSIRNADFWLWELTMLQINVRIISSFYPQCGFLALGTSMHATNLFQQTTVSIRNADFWLWEHNNLPQPSEDLRLWFLSAMRIFGFGNLDYASDS